MGVTWHINTTAASHNRKHYCFTVRKWPASIMRNLLLFQEDIEWKENKISSSSSSRPSLRPPHHVHLLFSEAKAFVIENPLRQCPSLALSENYTVSVHHFPI